MTTVELEPLAGEPAETAGALTFAVSGTVETTVEPDKPVVSELRLAIGAPPSPPGGEEGATATGEFYLTFRWGADPGALCTQLEAAAIIVTPDVDAEHWGVLRGSSPDSGPFWILTPPPGGGPPPGGSCGFLISNIVSASPADLPPTMCFASCSHATDGTIDDTATPSFWRTVPLAITLLESSPAAPTPGSPARLIWKTTGAGGCRLVPGGAGALPPSGELPFTLDGPREFALTAIGDAASVSRRVRVAPPSGWIELTRDEVVTEDLPVLLTRGKEVLCLQPQSGVVRSSRDGRGWKRASLTLPDRVVGAAGCGWAGGLALSGGLPVSTFDATASIVATSRDGRAWTAATSAAWPQQRSSHGTIEFARRLWAIGGVYPTGAACADVLSSADGVTWTASAAPQWTARARPGLAVHDDALWMSGGLSDTTAGASAFNDVWRLVFDPWLLTQTWEQGPVPPWNGTRAVTHLAEAGGRLYALVVPLSDQPVQLWRLGSWLSWEPAGAAPPVRTRRLLAPRLAMTAFYDGLLVVSDAGAWWYGAVSP